MHPKLACLMRQGRRIVGAMILGAAVGLTVPLSPLARGGASEPSNAPRAEDPTAQARYILGGIFVTATSHYGDTGTYTVQSVTELGYTVDFKAMKESLGQEAGPVLRYSAWYAVNGRPTLIPGSSLDKGPCDLTTPPATPVSARTDGFVAVVKGNLDADATCDEWSIDDKKLITHAVEDVP